MAKIPTPTVWWQDFEIKEWHKLEKRKLSKRAKKLFEKKWAKRGKTSKLH